MGISNAVAAQSPTAMTTKQMSICATKVIRFISSPSASHGYLAYITTMEDRAVQHANAHRLRHLNLAPVLNLIPCGIACAATGHLALHIHARTAHDGARLEHGARRASK